MVPVTFYRTSFSDLVRAHVIDKVQQLLRHCHWLWKAL